MDVVFKDRTESHEDAVFRVAGELKSNRANIFSRVEAYNEVIAIIPSDDPNEPDMFYWIWLSGQQGSYGTGMKRTRESIARSLIGGEWISRPGATIIL